METQTIDHHMNYIHKCTILTDEEVLMYYRDLGSKSGKVVNRAKEALFQSVARLGIKYAKMMHRYDQENDLMDHIQIANLKIMEILPKYDPKKGKLTTFVGTALKNIVAEMYNERKRKNRVLSFEEEMYRENDGEEGKIIEDVCGEEPDYPDELNRELTAGQVQRAVNQAGCPEHRELLKEYFWGGKTTRVIGKERRCSRQNIEQKIQLICKELSKNQTLRAMMAG